jgi:hypothetical protein
VNFTPLPGEVLPNGREIYQTIADRFAPRRGHGPLWHWMPRGERVEPQWLAAHTGPRVTLCTGAREARIVDTEALIEYFMQQKPWDTLRIYVVDSSLDWCLVSTEEFLEGGDSHDCRFLRFVVRAANHPVGE